MLDRKKHYEMNTYYFFWFLLVLTVFAGCVNSQGADTLELTGDTKTFTLQAKNWEFSPDNLSVKKGDRVILRIEGLDDGVGGGHGIAVPNFGINQNIIKGEVTTVEFIADTEGSFPFFCSVYCGAGHGSMKGSIIVE